MGACPGSQKIRKEIPIINLKEEICLLTLISVNTGDKGSGKGSKFYIASSYYLAGIWWCFMT